MLLGGVAEDKEGVGVIGEKLADDLPLGAQRQRKRPTGPSGGQLDEDDIECAESGFVTGQEERRACQRRTRRVGPVAIREGLVDPIVVQRGPEKSLGCVQSFLRKLNEQVVDTLRRFQVALNFSNLP